jgi:hypothetical protein
LTPALETVSVVTRRALAPRQRSAEWADRIQRGILAALLEGPRRLSELALVLGLPSRRVYKPHLVELHKAGAIRRLGVKGSSWWCVRGYRGPMPRSASAHVVTRRRAAASATTEPGRSWWLDVPAAEFQDAAAARARDQGWDA